MNNIHIILTLLSNMNTIYLNAIIFIIIIILTLFI